MSGNGTKPHSEAAARAGSGAAQSPSDAVSDALARTADQYRRIVMASLRTAAAFPDALVALAETSEKIVTTLPDALTALAEVSERMAVLAHQLERVNDTIDRASARVDQAADGMRRASAGIRDVVDMLGSSMPNLGSLDMRLDHLDNVISDLSGTIFSLLGSVPVLRRAVRPQGSAATPRAIPPRTSPGPEDS